MKKILNKHLEIISAFIESEDKVLDVGCDHGLLGIYLVLEKNVQRMVSSDVNLNPLEKARENLFKYHVEDKIELRLESGLDAMDKDLDTIVIAGMGGITISNILQDIKKYPNVKKIILSPNSDFALTRKTLNKLGFMINKEEIIFEKGKYYLISEYIKGKEKNNSFFGKLDLNKQEVKDYYQELYKKNKNVLKGLSLKRKLSKKSLIWENFLIKRKMNIIGDKSIDE